MYQRGSVSVVMKSALGPEDELEQSGEDKVYGTQEGADNRGDSYDHDGEPQGLLAGRPRNPSQLGDDLTHHSEAEGSSRHALVLRHSSLTNLSVQLVSPAPWAVLPELKPLRIVAAVLTGVVSPLATVGTG